MDARRSRPDSLGTLAASSAVAIPASLSGPSGRSGRGTGQSRLSAVSETRVQELPASLVAWIEATAGAPVVAVERRHAGGSREGWWVDVGVADGATPLFLRRDAGNGPLSRTRYSLEREARTLVALRGTGLLVPEVLGIDDREHCYLMQRMPGQADFRRIAATPEWDEVSRHYVEQLCRLHALDPAKLPLPDHPIPRRPEDHALFEVESWAEIYARRVSAREPVAEFGFVWLRHHAPRRVQRTVLVHGDAGPANFLFQDGRVTALIDWELSHVGDPMEDIAGLCVRGTWTPFGNLSTYLSEYEKRSDLTIERESVLYYMLMQFMRAVVGELVALEGFPPATEVTLNTMSLVLGMRGMHQVMARVAGLPAGGPRPEPPPSPSAARPYFEVLAHNLETILAPELRDPYLAHRGRQLATLARCLERAAALGPALHAEERDDIARILGRRSGTLADAEIELCERIRGRAAGTEPELIEYLGRRCERKAALWAPALGPLYANPLCIPEEL
jgi:aminoglycoside phosphotransferase (APT) family kinase protein